MKYQSLLIIIALFFLLGSSCKKDKLVNEIDKLPPATQTGANTFGCLVNGKAWIAQNMDCSIICDDPFKVSYDGSYGGIIGITGDWLNSSKNIEQRIDILVDSSNYKLLHQISIANPHHSARYLDYKNLSCGSYDHYVDTNVIHSGSVLITKYDLQNGIISGTFDITLTKLGCETISITNGRFDKKL